MTQDTALFDVPILLIIFNRPEYTRRVFDAIRKVRPQKLYIAADGPRDNIDEDILNCEHSREVVSQINWQCETHKLFREKNLGCRDAVYGALQWFFSEVDEGIILEDDTLPSRLFFPFCKNLLERYRNNQNVMMITGTSHFSKNVTADFDYYFSTLASVWGWASWKRAWDRMELRPSAVDLNLINGALHHTTFSNYLYKMITSALQGSLNTWDVQWAYSIILNSGFVIRPINNLISNIGHEGTHVSKSKKVSIFFDMPFGEFDATNMRHPKTVSHDRVLDSKTVKALVKGTGIEKNIRNILKQKIDRLYDLLFKS